MSSANKKNNFPLNQVITTLIQFSKEKEDTLSDLNTTNRNKKSKIINMKVSNCMLFCYSNMLFFNYLIL